MLEVTPPKLEPDESKELKTIGRELPLLRNVTVNSQLPFTSLRSAIVKGPLGPILTKILDTSGSDVPENVIEIGRAHV